MKRILFILPRRPGIGGITKASCFVANISASLNYETIIVGPKEKKSTLSVDEKIKWIDVECDAGSNSYISKITNKCKDILMLRRIITKEKPNCVVSFGADSMRRTQAALLGLKIKTIGSERGNPGRYSPKLRGIYERVYNKCDAVIFLTEEAREFFNVSKPQTYIIPNPAIQRIGSEQINKTCKQQILLCGSLTPDKNFSMAIKAFNMIKDRIPHNMIIYGEGRLYDQLHKEIHALGVEQRVFIKKPIPNVFYEEQGSTVFVLSSKEEGMPNVLLEALSLGIPCISTDCPAGGAKAIIGNNERGILVKNDDAEKMADAMIEICSNDDKREYYSQKAREVNSLFSPTIIGKKWKMVFEKV